MPFVLRIGYVFIVLAFVMVGISLTDKNHRTENQIDESSAGKMVSIGSRFVILALLAGIVSGFFVYPLRSYALEAIYVPIAGFILIGLIMIFNNRIRKMDSKSIILDNNMFKTSMTFNIASIGICGILAALYYFFW